MRATIALWLLLALLQPAAPSLTATWDGPRSAVIAWEGSGALWRVPANGGEHWIVSGAVGAVRLGPGGDQNYTPRPGDRYELRSFETGEVLATAGLSWRVILPVVVKG